MRTFESFTSHGSCGIARNGHSRTDSDFTSNYKWKYIAPRHEIRKNSSLFEGVLCCDAIVKLDDGRWQQGTTEWRDFFAPSTKEDGLSNCILNRKFSSPLKICLGLLGHMAVLYPVFEGISTLFSIVDCTSLHSHQQGMRLSSFLNFSHFNRCVISYHCFNSQCPEHVLCWLSFHMLIATCISSLGEVSIHISHIKISPRFMEILLMYNVV